MTEEKTKPKTHNSIIGLRTIEVLCVAAMITGFVWATSDLLIATVLATAPVTPMSVLLMIYGTMGLLLCEVAVRLIQRGEKRFLQQ